MIIYNVTINIDQSVHEEWLKWMKEVHIPDVMLTGIFSSTRMLKILGDEDSGGHTYAIQYSCESVGQFRKYEELYAPSLRASTDAKFKDKYVAFRTLLEEV